MPEKKYDYTVKVGADIRGLKKDIKSELASVLREVDNVGDAVSKGIAPDTSEFESKIASLDSKMERLATSTGDLEKQVASMKTAFKGFTELEAKMRVISEQNQKMYDTFVKMTPYLHAFSDTFAAMKPEQATQVFATVLSQMVTSGQAGSQAFRDMQGAMDGVADAAKQAGTVIHQVETDAASGAKAVNGVVETVGHSVQNMTQDAKKAAEELARLQAIRKSYNSDKNYNSNRGQNELRSNIVSKNEDFDDLRAELESLSPAAENYNAQLVKTIEVGQQLLALMDRLSKTSESNEFIEQNLLDTVESSVKQLLEQYKNAINTVDGQVGRVQLRPLTLKVKLEDDDKIIAAVNEKIDRIKEKIDALRVPIDFYDPDEELKKLEKKKEKIKKSEPVDEAALQKTLDNEAYNKTFTSLQKKAERIKKAFTEASKDLSKELEDFKDKIDKALTLKFKWDESDDNAELTNFFRFIQEKAARNPIELYIDKEKFINDIQDTLNQQKFKLEIDGAANITGSFSGNIVAPTSGVKPIAGAIPVVFKNPISGNTPPITGQPTNDRPIVPLTSSAAPPTTTAQDQLEEKIIEENSAAVSRNTDAIEASREIISEEYMKQAESLAKMGTALNKAYSDLDRQIIPYQQSLESLIDLFGNNNWITQWKDKLLQSAEYGLSQAQAAVSAAPGKIESAQKNQEETAAYAAKMEAKATEAEANYKAAEALYNELIKKLESAKKEGRTSDVTDLQGQIRKANEQKTSLYTEFKEAERSVTTAKENARNAVIALNEAKSKAEMAATALAQAERKKADIKALGDISTPFDEVSDSAQKLLSKMQELTTKYATDIKGGITQYLSDLSTDIYMANDRANDSALSESDRKKAAEESVQLSKIRDEIVAELRPFIENFDNAKKSIVGDISKLLKGYKIEVIFKDAKGKDLVYSFNNANEGADKESGLYWSKWVEMMNEVRSGTITSIRALSTPNMSDLRMVYEGTMTKADAVNNIVSAYSQLDDKTRAFVDGFISDIKLFLDEGASASKRWKVIEDSFTERTRRYVKGIGELEQLDVNSKLNTKYKSVTNKKDVETAMGMFMRALSDAIDGVNAEKGTCAGRQKRMARNTDSAAAVTESPKYTSPSHTPYGYSAQDRDYRTERRTVRTTDNEKAYQAVSTELENEKQSLVRYNSALAEAEKRHSDEVASLDASSQARKELQKQYASITDYQSFIKSQSAEQKSVSELRSAFSGSKASYDSTKSEVGQLYSDLERADSVISSIESRINSVSEAGGVKQYLEQLNEGLREAETRAESFREIIKQNETELSISRYAYTKGEKTKEQYEAEKKEIEGIIAENEALVRSEQDKYARLKAIKDSFSSEISGYDKKTGTIYQLGNEEYYAKKQQDLADAQKQSEIIQQSIGQAESRLAQANANLETVSAQLKAKEENLQQMRIAFAEYYYQYVQEQLRNIEEEQKNLDNIERTGHVKSYGEDEFKKRKSELTERRGYYSSEERRIKEMLGTGSSAKKEVDRVKELVSKSEERITQLETQLASMQKEGTTTTEYTQPAPYKEWGEERVATAIRREVETINADLELANARIEEAKKEKSAIQRKIDSLTKYGAKSRHYTHAKASQTIEAAKWLSENDETYQALVKQLQQQVDDGKITREAATDKRLEYVRQFKENNSEYSVSVEELIANQRRLSAEQDRRIQEAKTYQTQLDVEKKKALEILGITEDQLFAQKEITEEKHEQNGSTTTPSPAVQGGEKQPSSTPKQDIGGRVEDQSGKIDSTFVAKIDAKLADNDKKIAELQAQVGTSGKASPTEKFKEYFVSSRSKTIGDAADKLNRDFYNTLKQGSKNKKGQTFADFSDAGNIDAIIKKAQELRASLAQMYKDGKEGSKEFLVTQQQLTDLLERTRKNVSQTDLANGYEKNKKSGTMSKKAWEKFLTDRGADDLVKFLGSKYNLSSKKNVDSSILTDKVKETISGLSEEYQQAAIKAYTDAFNAKKASLSGSGKSEGQIESIAKSAALKAFDEFVKKQKDGFIAGTQEGADSPEIDAAKAELTEQIGEVEEENKELRDLRERYIKGMLSEKDNDLLASFIADSILDENQVDAMIQKATEEAMSSVDKTGKTESQIANETRELIKKKLFSMFTAIIGGAKEGIGDAGDSLGGQSSAGGGAAGAQGYKGFVQADNLVIQANNVVVNGNAVGTSGESSGPWALETTLQKTNEILNTISGKIDSVKGGSASNTSNKKSAPKKKKTEIDIDTARDALYQAADKNMINSFGEGVKSVRKFDEGTLRLYETLTLANGESVKFTYSINKMDGSIKTSYTTIANFEKVAKNAFSELNKNNISTEQLFDKFNFPEEKVNAYKNAVIALRDAINNLGEEGVTTSEQAQNIENLTANVKKARTEIENIVKTSEKLAREGTLVKAFGAGELSSYNSGDIRSKMLELAQQKYGSSVKEINFESTEKGLKQLIFTVETGRHELTTLTYAFDETTNSIYKMKETTKDTGSILSGFFSGLKAKIGELFRYYTSMSLITQAFQKLRQGVQYVREIDLQLTELKKVTEATEAQYKSFLQTMSQTASVVGSTVANLTASSADWARLNI